MHLIDFAKAGRDQHAAIGKPIEKACLACMQIPLNALGELRIGRGNALQNEIAALLVHRRRQLRLSLSRAIRRGRQRQQQQQQRCLGNVLGAHSEVM